MRMAINVLPRHEWSGEPIELGDVWMLEKEGRRLVCRLLSHPLGWELRLEVDRELWQSQACKTENDLFSTAREWREQAESNGWQQE